MLTRKKLWLSLLATPFLCELALQTIALIAWGARPSPDTSPKTTRHSVLCAGDSWTQGVGSSAPTTTYPSQLQKQLRTQLGADWSVANRGIAGHDSLDCLRQLRQQVESVRPRFVCLLIGRNDHSTRPALWEGVNSEYDEFRVCFRLGRLASMIWNRTTKPTEEATDLARDGGLSTKQRARIRESRLAKALPCEPRLLDATAHKHIKTSRAAATAADFELAIREARAGLRILPESPEGNLHLILALRSSGKLEELEACLASLQQRYDRQPSVYLAESLVQAVQRLSRPKLQHTLIERYGPLYPNSHIITRESIRDAMGREEFVKARRLVDHFLKLKYSPLYIHPIADALCKLGEQQRCAELLFSTFREHGDSERLLRLLRGLSWQLPETAVRKAFESWDCLGNESEVIKHVANLVYAEGKGKGKGKAKLANVLESHLSEAAAQCRRRGIHLFILNYARPRPLLDGVRRRVATTPGVSFIDISAAFALDRIKSGAEFGSYYAANGHPNDRGYAVLAAAVADTITAQVRKK